MPLLSYYYSNRKNYSKGDIKMKFIVETSARHVHVTEETFTALFGEGKRLNAKKNLSHPDSSRAKKRSLLST